MSRPLIVRTNSGFTSPIRSDSNGDSLTSTFDPLASPAASPATWQQNSANGGIEELGSPLNAGTESASPSNGNGTTATNDTNTSTSSQLTSSSSTQQQQQPASNNILVSIRIRPLSERELAAGEQNIWRTNAANNSIEEENDLVGKRYTYDYICPPTESTTDLYKNLVRKLVLKACIGYNSNVFAYGQTASGKTFSILGSEFSPGIVLLAIGDIFHYIAQSPGRQFLLRVSCLEIYNEEVNDLLATGPNSRNLKLENVGGLNKDGTLNINATHTQQVKIKGLTQEFVRSPSEFIALLLRGEENRKIASTDANLRSSRSHTMFRIHIESRARATPEQAAAAGTAGQPQPPPNKKIRSSLLTFVDLAGSECISQLGGSAERQKECRHINKSLLGLSRVIVKLSEGDNGQHVPYRDSKLTRILKPALGGNSHTLFLCCISPNLNCKEESHNTLRFGSFANQVQNIAHVNLKEERVREDITKYQHELEKLRQEMERKRLEEEAELLRLKEHNDELKKLLEIKDQSLEETTDAAMKAADAVRAAQELLEKERLEKERLAKENQATEEQEKEYLKMQLKISQAQIKLLEEKMIPLTEEAAAAKNENKAEAEAKHRELLETINQLRDQNSSLESAAQREREEYEAEQKRIHSEKDGMLKSLLAEKITEQQRLESKIQAHHQSLQSTRKIAMSHGMEIMKVNRKKESPHDVKLWLNHEHTQLFWTRVGGMAGAFTGKRSIALREIERIKLGQATPAFEKIPANLKSNEYKSRSFSIVTPARTLDLIAPNAHTFDLWTEGLRSFLSHSAKIEDMRPNAAGVIPPTPTITSAATNTQPKRQAVEEMEDERKEPIRTTPAPATIPPKPTTTNSTTATSSTSSPPVTITTSQSPASFPSQPTQPDEQKSTGSDEQALSRVSVVDSNSSSTSNTTPTQPPIPVDQASS